jgi:alpha-glucosidase
VLSSGPEPRPEWEAMREVPVDCTVYLRKEEADLTP